jgi:hypothetical protein
VDDLILTPFYWQKIKGWLVNQNEEQGNNIRIKPLGDLNSLVNAIGKGL